MEQEVNQAVFFPFSKGIPWRLRNGIINPKLSDLLWDKFVAGLCGHVICAGLFLEHLLLPQFINNLNKNKISVRTDYISSYYDDMLSAIGVPFIENEDPAANPIDDFKKSIKIMDRFPSPVFFNKKNQAFFNMCLNAGMARTPEQEQRGIRSDPFFEKILSNTCREYIPEKVVLDRKLIDPAYKQFCSRFKINPDKKFIIIDNEKEFINSTDTDVMYLYGKRLSIIDIQALAKILELHGINILLISDEYKFRFFGYNVVHIEPWYKQNSLEWLALISKAGLIISRDPNVYLAGAIAGCKRIIVNGVHKSRCWYPEYAKPLAEFDFSYIEDIELTNQVIIKVLSW